MHFVETRGHVLTFAHLPYVPAHSRDPQVKPTYYPTPDFSAYLTILNNQIKHFGDINPIGKCFSNKRFCLSSNK